MASTAANWERAFKKNWAAFDAYEIEEREYLEDSQEWVEEAAEIARAANTPDKRLRAAELIRKAASILKQTEQHIAFRQAQVAFALAN